MKPGGFLEARFPHRSARIAVVDPTHSRLILPATFLYFDPVMAWEQTSARFRVRGKRRGWAFRPWPFHAMELSVRRGQQIRRKAFPPFMEPWEWRVWLEAVKDGPPAGGERAARGTA